MEEEADLLRDRVEAGMESVVVDYFALFLLDDDLPVEFSGGSELDVAT